MGEAMIRSASEAGSESLGVNEMTGGLFGRVTDL